MNLLIRRRPQQRLRCGAAVVEFAVCLPVLMLLILGSIEATSAVFLKQAITTAAYEGIREAIRPGSDAATSISRAVDVLNVRQIRNFTVSFTPVDIRNAARGQRITAVVTAQLSANSPFMGRVIADRTISVRSVMIKE